MIVDSEKEGGKQDPREHKPLKFLIKFTLWLYGISCSWKTLKGVSF
jgi:hypothetical protein